MTTPTGASPPRPQAYHARTRPITRRFPEFRYIEQQDFLETGAFPPQHLIVLRREAWEAFRLGLTRRLITAEEYFADYLQRG